LALWLTGVLTSIRAALLFIAQIAGGLVASALVLGLTPKSPVDADARNTSLSSGVTYAQGFLLEMLGTSVLIFSVLMLGE
jgi:aquaporin rerated protein, other eukaryote